MHFRLQCLLLLFSLTPWVSAASVDASLQGAGDHHSFDLSPVTSNHSLSRRQTSGTSVADYTCSANRPCRNKACCGESNVCGYGPIYCGDGCQSHCDAHAECGQYAEEPDTTCPLNVCCSQFGFCGTTTEFCDGGCQSNCGQPSKPGGGNDVRNKIVGYWESWNSKDTPCPMPPDSIPVEGLDQLNLAFIYINPETYELMPMDGVDIKGLYEQLGNLKARNPHLEVWISIGGWSFNDPGPYRRIFGTIAGDTRLSARFADYCRDFMNQYGFDGVDIDWEYPGADDRAGRLEDITNYPRMLGILNHAFKTSGGKRFGLTITVPTSYWYLKWFNVAKIEPVIDSFNLMSYDLHGIWDSTDPIGPYIYGHTNLTEIDAALDLFWRNKVSSKNINLGLAFYGRTFKLKDPHCAHVGCEFSGPGDQGRCTRTPGILSYKEVRELLIDQGLAGDAHYDEEAAVYYINYAKDSWISFDDTASFQAKVDLANKRGLGGLFIWAVDQDDDNLNALKAVTGRDDLVTPVKGSDTLGGFDIDKCYITDCNVPCGLLDTTMTHLNMDKDGKGCAGKNHNQRSFCCPPSSAPDPDTCYWTGGPVNCHGQCAPGDVTMVLDDWGDSKKRCTNGGKKAWCCPATNGQALIQKCELLNKYGQECPSDKSQELTYVSDVVYGLDPKQGRSISYGFCCPDEPEFKNCAWQGDNNYCNDNYCPRGQVELFRHNGYHGGPKENGAPCNKGRQQAFCCDPPFTGGSPFLPVPLENLFPDASNFDASWDPEFAEAYDLNDDLQPSPGGIPDPNEESFAWVIVVGDPSDVQSFDKRDGTHLELFDCPNPDPEDLSVQKVRAICLTDSLEHDCEDLLQGGVEGTVVRLPAHCGPDTLVRAVSWERSNNKTLPRHLEKRAKSHHQIYDFHYDYDFRNLRRDGGEIYVRIDASTHRGYWDEVVANKPGSPVKRDASNWRDIDKRGYAEHDSSDWQARFDKLLEKKNTGLKKHYEFRQCLIEAEAECGKADAFLRSYVAGSFDTTFDFGTTLIGTLRNFGFTEAFAFFRHESFEAKLVARLQAQAKLEFNSGMKNLGSFDAWGSNYNLKGIVILNPYLSLDAQIQARISASVDAEIGVSLASRGFQYYLPTFLGGIPTNDQFDTTGNVGHVLPLGSINTEPLGGDLIISTKMTVGFDIELYWFSKQLVDTSVKLVTTSAVDFHIGTSISSATCRDIGVGVTIGAGMVLDVGKALPGWDNGSNTYVDFDLSVQIYEQCLSFLPFRKREIASDTAIGIAANEGSLLPRADDPDVGTIVTSGTCVYSTRISCADGSEGQEGDCNLLRYCPDDDDDGGPDSTSKRDLSSIDALLSRFFAEVANGSADGETHLLDKRSTSGPRYYCQPARSPDNEFAPNPYAGVNGNANRGKIYYLDYPSSSEVARDFPNNLAFDFEDDMDCNNYDLRIRRATQITNTAGFGAEHVLENQMLPNFMNKLVQAWSDLRGQPGSNPNARHYRNPRTSQGDTDWCEYMHLWWNNGGGRDNKENANSQVAKAYPSYGRFDDEMFLLVRSMNSGTKQTWFAGTRIRCERTIEGLFDRWQTNNDQASFSSILCCLKNHIGTWNYYGHPDVTQVLADQARRVENYLASTEQMYIPANVPSGLVDPYVNQHLSIEWRAFVEHQHDLVMQRVGGFVREWTRKIVDAADGSTNQRLVDQVEALRLAASGLRPWNIPW